MRDINRLTVRAIIALVMCALSLSVSYPQSKSAIQENPVFRPPFVLKLRIDKEHSYEETFNKVPYVAGNVIYLFGGENFGINVTIIDNQISRVAYQKDIAKADIEFKFTQEKSPEGFIMLLVTRNKLRRKVFFDALITLPSDKNIYNTTVLPVEPSLSSFESWPHPVVQLVLRNLRFSDAR
jgi:hypothetical protein